jgi:hypothetical protein
MRRRVGVEGGAVDDDATGRVGETGRRGEGGVTSVCSMDVKIAFACSAKMMSRDYVCGNNSAHLSVHQIL